MANALGELFSDIADAIREKNNETETMNPSEFPEKIRGLTGEGVDPYYQKLAEALMKRSAEYLSGNAKTMSMKGFKVSDGATLASLQPYSFAGFSNVEGMEFTDVIMVQENAFTGNSKLKILDITTDRFLSEFPQRMYRTGGHYHSERGSRTVQCQCQQQQRRQRHLLHLHSCCLLRYGYLQYYRWLPAGIPVSQAGGLSGDRQLEQDLYGGVL